MSESELPHPPVATQAERRRRFRGVPMRLLLPNVITLLALSLGLTAIRFAPGNTFAEKCFIE